MEWAASTWEAVSRKCSPPSFRRTSRCGTQLGVRWNDESPSTPSAAVWMYLGQSLADLEGKEHPMLGVVPAVSRMSDKRLTLGYREVEAASDGPLLRKGQRVRGHEFHWSTLDRPPSAGQSVYRVVNQDNRVEGFQVGSVLGVVHPRPPGKPPFPTSAVRGHLRRDRSIG